jgi:hypothetical protein
MLGGSRFNGWKAAILGRWFGADKALQVQEAQIYLQIKNETYEICTNLFLKRLTLKC